MVNFDNELNKVEYIKPMTSGEPGNRIFSIELYTSQKSYKIFVEKEQLISVSEYIIRNLYSINISDSNEENKQDFDYIDEEIKSNNIQIEIQSNNKIFILYFREETETEIFNKLKINLNFNQALLFAQSTLKLASQGRPLCKLCYRPMNKNDKSDSDSNICINCPRKNGHYKQKN
tara:strand:- start:103 stop:627 length:525 start_codon:yes stop_codon:yes gene_type:complete